MSTTLENGGRMPFAELTNTLPVYALHLYTVDDIGLGMVGVLHPGVPATPDIRNVLAEALHMAADRLTAGDPDLAQHVGKDKRGRQ